MSPSGKPVNVGGWLVWSDGDTAAYVAKGGKTSDFLRWDMFADSNGEWTALTPIPPGQDGKLPHKGCRGVSDGRGHIYMVYGSKTRTFSRYDIASRAWTELEKIPPQPSGEFAQAGSDMVFVWQGDTGYAYLLKGKTTDFCRFNTFTGQWQVLPSAPNGAKAKYAEGSWLVFDGDHTIYCHKAKYQELWRFDINAGRWLDTMLPGMPLVGSLGKSKKSKSGGCGVFVGGRIYALKGGNTQEFWCYSPAEDTWRERDTIPSLGSTGRRRKVRAGGDIAAWSRADYGVLALKGGRTVELWKYYGLYDAAPDQRPHGGRAGALLATPSARAGGTELNDGGSPTQVRDISGRMISHGSRIPAGLPAGIYFVRTAGAGQPTRKLVVVR